jgi:spermidine synthase
MYRSDPDRLVLSYTRLMMAFLLFQPAPRDLVIIGLGGGSLSKYCYRHLPRTRITNVEINARVIALRDTFAIPADNERFRVVHGNGADFIAAPPQDIDVILLDGFDVVGLPRELGSQHFYDGCASALREGGVLVANFLQSDEGIDEYLDRMSTAFDHRMMTARSEDRGNRIACSLKRAQLPPRLRVFERAGELEKEHEIPFRVIASQLLSSLRPGGSRFSASGGDAHEETCE